MAGNARFEYTSGSPESSFAGNCQGGQRGYSAPTLDRSGSFRDGADGRSFSSGKGNTRGGATSSGDVTTLSQCLMLEPIVMGDQKPGRSGEVRRVLGISGGKGLEDNPFGASHLKNSPPVAVEELKRLRASFADTRVKASGRAKKIDSHLSKLNKYCETMSSKKQQRNEMLTNERSSGSTLKIGPLMHRNPSEFGNQKFDDRPKDGLNKRLRTSVAENRAECRSGAAQRQPLVGTKDRELLKDNDADSDMVEEKIRRLPAGGEGWDKKMKRKRSVGAVFSRSVDNDGEFKRTIHHKLTSESNLQSSDSTHGFRSGASGVNNRLDPASSPVGSSARATLRNETPSRDPSPGQIKERTTGKVNVRMNNREDNHSACPSPVVKGKASRTPRSGSMVAPNAAPNTPRLSATLESWEQPQGLNKIPPTGGTNNRKRSMPPGSSSPPITQWVGQRPQKISRTRRTNLIPVSNHEDVQMQSEGCSPSEFGPRIGTGGTNSTLPSKSSAGGSQNFKVKSENVPSPARLSESEESGAGENRIKEVEEKTAHTGHNVGPSAFPIKKNKNMAKEEIGDGVRRQGRSGRVSPFSSASMSPTRENLDNVASNKPLRNARSGSDKSGSKSGRPSKKLSDRKGFSRLGHMAGSSPDYSGESEDDHEELLVAANLACNSSSSACSSAIWKTVEALFASIGPDEKLFLSEQDDFGCEKFAGPDSMYSTSFRHKKSETVLKSSSVEMDFSEQLQDSALFGCSEAEKKYNVVTPLYQRVLSALITDDEIEEYEETGFGRPRSSVNDSNLIGTGSKQTDKLDFGESIYGVQTQENGNAQIFYSCNGNKGDTEDYQCNGERLQGDGGYIHSEVEELVRLSRSDYVPQSLAVNNCVIPSFDCQYEQMSLEEKLVLELRSIGLFLEAVPSLDDKEEDVINQEIIQLERGLHEQIVKKKSCLNKLIEAIEEGNDSERRDPEQVAMDKLVELAYKKLLATRGSYASKHGITKILRPVALAFAKRTLAKCRKFEDSGTSCFSEPALRDIVYAPPPRFDETELLTGANLAVANDLAKNGTIANRGKRKELSLDGVGGAVFRASSALGILGGTKGKRSERDRDPSTKNAIAKAGRSSLGGSKGERKAKSKPKQKTAQLSNTTNSVYPSGSGSGDSANNNSGNRRKDVRFMSTGNVPPLETKESMEFTNLPPNDIDGIDELGVDSEIGEPQDLNSWFNFDVDGLQDNDSVGLEIPMDDLAELNMF